MKKNNKPSFFLSAPQRLCATISFVSFLIGMGFPAEAQGRRGRKKKKPDKLERFRVWGMSKGAS